MNKSLIAALLLVCGGALYAKEPSKKIKAEVAALQTAAAEAVKAEAVQARKDAKAEQVKAAAARQEQEAEDSEDFRPDRVVVDNLFLEHAANFSKTASYCQHG